VTPGCARFTFSPGEKACIMYAAYAEMVLINDLTSGSIPSKMTGASNPAAAANSGVDAPVAASLTLEPPAPALPIFAKLESLPPPPPPDLSIHGDSTALQDLISDLSVIVFSAIFVGCLMCTYCFFAPQILTSLHRATDGRIGKVHVRSHRYVHHQLPADEDQFMRLRANSSTAIVPIDEPPRRKKRSSRKSGQRLTHVTDGRENDRKSGAGRRKVRLVVQTTAITQSRDVAIGLCASIETLRTLFYDEFTSALKGVQPAHAQLFCLAPAPPPKDAVLPPTEQKQEQPLAWLLISSRSDFARVRECPAFRLQDQRCDEALNAQYVVAFPETQEEDETACCDRRPVKGREASEASPAPCDIVSIAESRRGRSRDRRGLRGSSTPASCDPCATDGADEIGGSCSDDSATSSRQSLIRGGTGTTRAPCIPPPDPARLATCLEAPPSAADLQAQALALTSSSVEHFQASCALPGGDDVPRRAMSVAGSTWEDDDPDGTGVSRVRAMVDLE